MFFCFCHSIWPCSSDICFDDVQVHILCSYWEDFSHVLPLSRCLNIRLFICTLRRWHDETIQWCLKWKHHFQHKSWVTFMQRVVWSSGSQPVDPYITFRIKHDPINHQQQLWRLNNRLYFCFSPNPIVHLQNTYIWNIWHKSHGTILWYLCKFTSFFKAWKESHHVIIVHDPVWTWQFKKNSPFVFRERKVIWL